MIIWRFYYILFYLWFELQTKYVGGEKGKEEFSGMKHVDKTLYIKGARISYSIWEVGGNFIFKFINFMIIVLILALISFFFFFIVLN